MSTRVRPSAVWLRRIATSSLKPNQKVSAVASIRPFWGSAAAIVQPRSRASANAASNTARGVASRISGSIQG